MVIATTRIIARMPHLGTFLADHPDAVAGWGRKRSGRNARWMARLLGRDYVLLEDGFIRSVERNASTMSLIVDDIGAYYDATRPSRMEMSISAGVDAVRAGRIRDVMSAWRQNGISKYNHAPDYDDLLPDRYVLVADQTFGDLSVAGGLADSASFDAMLAAAIAENPDCAILVKVHPDVLTGRKRGYLPHEAKHPRVRVVGSDRHVARLLEGAEAIYCATSLIGFEALLWGKPVRCFGMPFYAGWGLTGDERAAPARRHRATLEDVAHAALIALPRYADPAGGDAWEVEQAIAHVGARRAQLFGRAKAA